jgi:hypothetical protein
MWRAEYEDRKPRPPGIEWADAELTEAEHGALLLNLPTRRRSLR